MVEKDGVNNIIKLDYEAGGRAQVTWCRILASNPDECVPVTSKSVNKFQNSEKQWKRSIIGWYLWKRIFWGPSEILMVFAFLIRHYYSSLLVSWTPCQIRKIAGCACAGNAGNVFPATNFKRHPLITDSAMHSRCMRNPQFYASSKKPVVKYSWRQPRGLDGPKTSQRSIK